MAFIISVTLVFGPNCALISGRLSILKRIYELLLLLGAPGARLSGFFRLLLRVVVIMSTEDEEDGKDDVDIDEDG